MIPIKNDQRIDTGLGIYKDIQVNLSDIIQRGLSDVGEPLFNSLTFKDCNPSLINIQTTPTIFVWTDGEEIGSDVAGGALGRRQSVHSKYYVTVQLVLCGLDEESRTDELLMISNETKRIILENLNLNDIANGGGKIVQVDLRPELLRVNGRVRSMLGSKIFIEYTQTSQSRMSTR